MFGNPAISATPVDDLYSSQADVYGNSFANPMNPANMNPGWGIDPSLLSPSYTSSFRPQYSGPNGATDFGRPGFFSSVNKLMPWTDTPAWGNPVDHTQPYVDSVASRPVDGAMWFGQNVVMPYMGFRMAGKLLGGYNMLGMAKHARTAGQVFGRGLGAGIARGIGAAPGGLISRGLASGMGGAFGAAAGWGGPLALAQAMFYAGEKGVFNPYINTRRSAENLRDNFAGITFADTAGNSVTGGGFGGAGSVQVARQITRDGIQDMSLSTGEYGQLADMTSRAGLMDNVGATQISKRVKDSAAQVKLIMSVANMPEMKDAVEQLAKLQKMGANVSGGAYSDAAGAMRQLGGLASMAGTNVQKLMNTVGAQGQYLYQANGMTPYMGQIAAANNYAAFSVGSRMGLISSAQLARMGGLDGATQASLTGQLNASQSLYNKISSYNQYMGGGQRGEVIANLNQFGNDMAKNPMGVYGAMSLYGNQMAANRMSERGSLALDDQIYERLKNLPGMVDKNGKIAFEKAVPFMTQMGMSNDQIMAYGSQRVSETNEGAYKLNLKALNRNMAEQQRQLVERENLYGGLYGRTQYRLMKAGRDVTSTVGDITGGAMASAEGYLRDGIGKTVDNFWYGSSIKNSNETVEEALNGKSHSDENIPGFNIVKSKHVSDKKLTEDQLRAANMHTRKSANLAEEMNSALKDGDANVKAYMQGKTLDERRAALGKIMQSGILSKGSKDYLSSPDNFKAVDGYLQAFGRQESKPKEKGLWDNIKSVFSSPEKVENMTDKMKNELGLTGTDPLQNVQLIGRAYNAMSHDYDGQGLSTANIDALAKTDKNIQAIMKEQKFTDPQDALKFIQKAAGFAADNKIVGTSTASLRVRGKGIKGLEEATEANGGKFRDQNALETSHMTLEDKIKYTQGQAKDAEMKQFITSQYKQGRLDFSGFQESLNALDNKKSIDKFDKAVDKFVNKVDKDVESSGIPEFKPHGLFGAIFEKQLSTQKQFGK